MGLTMIHFFLLFRFSGEQSNVYYKRGLAAQMGSIDFGCEKLERLSRVVAVFWQGVVSSY